MKAKANWIVRTLRTRPLSQFLPVNYINSPRRHVSSIESFWISKEIWSPEVMCWTVVKESLGELGSPNILSGYQAACCTVRSTYWGVHSHLGAIGYMYYSFLCDYGIWSTLSPWMSHRGFLPRLDLCSTLFVTQHILLSRETFTSVTNHPHTSFTIHTPPYLTLLILLSLFAKYSVVPDVPTEAGSGRACPAAAPAPPPSRDWLTPLLSSQVILWHTSTHSHTSVIYRIEQGMNCVWMQAHTDSPFVYVWKTDGVPERVRTSDANNQWLADGSGVV